MPGMTGGRCRVAPVIAAKTSQLLPLPRSHLEQNLTPTFLQEGPPFDRFRFKRVAESCDLTAIPDTGLLEVRPILVRQNAVGVGYRKSRGKFRVEPQLVPIPQFWLRWPTRSHLPELGQRSRSIAILSTFPGTPGISVPGEIQDKIHDSRVPLCSMILK
jgi:hypothetical protein